MMRETYAEPLLLFALDNLLFGQLNEKEDEAEALLLWQSGTSKENLQRAAPRPRSDAGCPSLATTTMNL